MELSDAPSRARAYDAQQLNDLLSEVEAAAGADRELDAAIYRAFGDGAVFRGRMGWEWRQNNFGIWHGMPALTASLDAALALMERVLPETMWQVGFDPDDGSICARLVTTPPPCTRVKANHDTPPLALLAACLKALIAQNGVRDGSSH